MDQFILDQYEGLVAIGALYGAIVLLIRGQRARGVAALLIACIAGADVWFWHKVAQAYDGNVSEMATIVLHIIDFAGVAAALVVLAYVLEALPRNNDYNVDGAVRWALFYLTACAAYWIALPSQGLDLLNWIKSRYDPGLRIWLYVCGFAVSAALLTAYFWWNRRRVMKGLRDNWWAFDVLLFAYLCLYLVGARKVLFS